MLERRRAARLPVDFYVRQLVDGVPHRCFASNLSVSGAYLERILTPLERHSNTVQVELPLPGIVDPVWGRAEVVYDRFGHLFHGTAVRFTAMARKHRGLLRDWLRHQRVDSEHWVDTGHGVQILRPS